MNARSGCIFSCTKCLRFSAAAASSRLSRPDKCERNKEEREYEDNYIQYLFIHLFIEHSVRARVFSFLHLSSTSLSLAERGRLNSSGSALARSLPIYDDHYSE